MRILIAASGSGGHLFPAVYVAQAIKKLQSDSTVVFVGSGRPLEEKILGSAGHAVLTLPVKGLKNRGLRGLFQFLLSIPGALLQTRKIFNSVRPQVVIGVGGYVTFFPVLFARFSGIPSWIHEAELRPGLANHVLSYIATKVSVAFAEAQIPNQSKIVFTGHPVRPGLEVARNFEPLQNAPRNILIMGGSQGAKALDEAIPKLSPIIHKHSLNILHQCRRESVEEVGRAYQSKGIDARIVPFIDDMAAAYQWADIIISRSGAGSIMELGIVNKPSILVPFPYSQGNHQVANAQILANEKKAIICEEGGEFLERLEQSLLALLSLERYNEMKLFQGAGRPLDGAYKIAQGCLELIRRDHIPCRSKLFLLH